MSDDEFETLDGDSLIGFTSLPEGVRQLGPYRLISEIGRGAMGTVYRAQHEHLSRDVALKVLPEELAASPDRYARFQREMQAIGRLEHPNIVLATDAGQIDGVCYIAMQLIEGIDLAELISQREKLTIGEAAEVARQVALGLSEIDRHEMIHRDIKPSNLLLASNGEVKILDLGIASLRHTTTKSDSLTMTGSFLGTPDYVAPEQISTDAPVDIRADIYSLGCTLYHLLSGRPPFSGPEYKSLPAKLLGHAEKDAEPLNEIDADISDGLAQIVNRMMAKNPADRYGSPADVAQALNPFCDSRTLDQTAKRFGNRVRAKAKAAVATTVSSETLSQQISDRKKRALWMSLALTIALIGLGSIYYGMVLPRRTQTRSKHDSSSNELASHVGKIGADAHIIADNTGRIAMTLEQMQEQFERVVKEINADPKTPSQWYANAIQYANSGNQSEARRAFLQFFKFELNVVDPYQSFADALRVQEGTAGAREIFASLPGDAQLPARLLASIRLMPRSEQRPALQELANEYIEFGPVYFALSQSYVRPNLENLTLTEKLAKKDALLKYVDLHEHGKVLKYYLDQSHAEKALTEAQSQLGDLAKVNRELLSAPITMTPHLLWETNRWELTFDFAEDAMLPEFRDDENEEFRSMAPNPPLSQSSGQNAESKLDDAPSSTKLKLFLGPFEDVSEIQIRYQDRNGIVRGPYSFAIDLRTKRIEAIIQSVEQLGQNNWVNAYDRRINFPITHYGFGAVKQVNYGVNQEEMDRQFALPEQYTGSPKERDVVIEKPIEFVTYQVVFENGELSEVHRYEAKAETE